MDGREPAAKKIRAERHDVTRILNIELGQRRLAEYPSNRFAEGRVVDSVQREPLGAKATSEPVGNQRPGGAQRLAQEGDVARSACLTHASEMADQRVERLGPADRAKYAAASGPSLAHRRLN